MQRQHGLFDFHPIGKWHTGMHAHTQTNERTAAHTHTKVVCIVGAIPIMTIQSHWIAEENCTWILSGPLLKSINSHSDHFIKHINPGFWCWQHTCIAFFCAKLLSTIRGLPQTSVVRFLSMMTLRHPYPWCLITHCPINTDMSYSPASGPACWNGRCQRCSSAGVH